MAVVAGSRIGEHARTIIFVPIGVLTVISAATSGLLLFGNDIPSGFASLLLICLVAIYGAAVTFLARLGLGKVAQLEALGMTDPLSGLPNRRALHGEIAEGFDTGDEIAIALIDLDGFKMVNDLHGHSVGDQLIKLISEELRNISSGEASAYRLGGDEFALRMCGPLAGTILEGMCRSLLDRLSQPLPIDDRRITIGASIGLSRRTRGEDISSSEMLRRADVAMYVSKRGGKMRCTWFRNSFDRKLESIRDLDTQLREALVQNEFRVLYQPLVETTGDRIVAVESLLRWERAGHEPIAPDIFIPVAEESGLIHAIGLWVLRQACTDALRWDDITLSVNISAAQLRNPEFPIQLGNILEETDFPPERLELEITETCLVLDPAVAEQSLTLIRSFGVNVALDDFGTGYASIGFLRQFRFEKLKLDRSLIVDSANDESSRAMMLSSISMARALKMHVIAEGVETQDQADMVRLAGCDQIQGWLYYKPMPAQQVEAHLADEPVVKMQAQI